MKEILADSRQCMQKFAVIAAGILLLVSSKTSYAEDDGLTVAIQPHCTQEEHDEETLFGEIPDIDPLIDLGPGHCFDFQPEDPRTLKTSIYRIGDTVDLDIAIKNPDEESIKRARVWVSYDPSVLGNPEMEINREGFTRITPGENDFDEEQGYMMIDVSADDGDEPDDKRILIANVRFKVISTPDAGTILSFYDVQTGGHTDIRKSSAVSSEGIPALSKEPGSLHVIFSAGLGDLCEKDEDCSAGTCVSGICSKSGGLPEGSICQIDSQCEAGYCVNGICKSASQKPEMPNGNACSDDKECQNGFCLNGICEERPRPPLSDGSECRENSECLNENCKDGFCASVIKLPDGSRCTADSECTSLKCLQGFCTGSGTEPPMPAQTAFSLLQVQNLRITTADSSAYLGWDSLNSSQLKAYNIYYGTTVGQYIQRKTVAGNMQSLALHNLPTGSTYYFAVRAVSFLNEESAYSSEVSVTIGNPATSTAPLMIEPSSEIAGSIAQNAGSVQGNTGISSTLIPLIFISALTGTVIAWRRQLNASLSSAR